MTGLKNKKTTTVSIPNTVTVNGCTFTVTAIANKAFSGNSYIKKVTTGKSLKTIGVQAFSKCKALTTVKLSSGVTTIKKKAFYGCKKLKTVKITSTVLKKAGSKCFSGISSKAVIRVPAKKVAAYKKLLKVNNVRK